MRWLKTYIPTLRESPAEAELESHRLLVRGGYIRRLAAGVYIYLPLMQRVLERITRIVREEMNAAGGIEILMPVLHPAEIWQRSGRWDGMGKEQMRMKDRHAHDMVLGGTHEEVVTSLVAGELKSYKQLPLNLYQIQTKFRDEIRPRFGLMRGREFIMKDAYSFDVDEKSHKIAYQNMVDAYFRIFERCGLETVKVESDTGAMGGTGAHEFMVLVDTNGGEEVILSCDKCDYAANIEKAEFRDKTSSSENSDLRESEVVQTPSVTTIEQVSEFLRVRPYQLVKTLIYVADGKPVAALVRGDRAINEVKLKNYLACGNIEMAGPELVEELTGAPVGFAGPVGLKARLIVDPLVTHMINFVTGANTNDAHIVNVNFGRDFISDEITDISNAREEDRCPRCDGRLVAQKGIEVGNTFMLGTKYSDALDGTFLDAEGKERPYVMGSYGIGITRTAQAAVERYHDDKGIIWPKHVAPYDVILTPLNIAKKTQREAAEKIYRELTDIGLEVLYDDRQERTGVKLNDADLIGIPLRVAIGDRSLARGKVEVKLRGAQDLELIDIESVKDSVRKLLVLAR